MRIFLSVFTNPYVFWSSVGIVGFFGLMAIVAPDLFRRLAKGSSTWVDTSKAFAMFDKRVELDSFFLRYPRVLGAILLSGLMVSLGLFFGR